MSATAISKQARPASDSRETGQSRLRIGGMAMENGILFQTDRHWSLGVRDDEGGIRVASGRKLGLSRTSRIKRTPFLRGMVTMAETLALLPRVHSSGGRLPLPARSPDVLASMLVTVAGSLVLRNPKRPVSPLLEELLVSVMAVVPSLVALRKTHATQYHAVEHKSINAYEDHGFLEKGDTLGAQAEHPRCGSNIVGPALALMTLGNIMSRRVLGRQSSAARVGVSFLSLSGAIELVQWAARHPASPWSAMLRRPGGSLQHLVTTSEPTDEQLDVGLAALRELISLEQAG